MSSRSKVLLQGAFDMHVHSNPHVGGKKNLDSIEAVIQAEKAGMRGIVLKCNSFPTGGSAYLISRLAKDIKIFGGIALNATIGGINPEAVEEAIFYGQGKAGEFTKIIWLPTLSSPLDVSYHKRSSSKKVEVLKNGRIVPELYKIFELIAKHNLIMATGHISEEEALRAIEAAKGSGVRKIIVTHPSTIIPNISQDGQKKMANLGVFIEFTYVGTTEYYREKYHHSVPVESMAKLIKEIGVDRCILSTDMGGDPGISPSPVQGMEFFIAELLENSLSEPDIEVMAKKNPAKLLGLE